MDVVPFVDGPSAGPPAGPPADNVLCPKCKECVTLETLANTTQAKKQFHTGNSADCRECNLNYKAENRKHVKDAARRKVREAKGGDDTVEWYRKKKVLPLHWVLPNPVRSDEGSR